MPEGINNYGIAEMVYGSVKGNGMEKRIELSRSTIICSQREPESWKFMIMNDEVSANAIMKRATKHYVVMIQLKGST